MSVLLGTLNGAFARPIAAAGTHATGVVLADVNGDGKPDPVVMNDAGDLVVLFNEGYGLVRPAGQYAVPAMSSLAAAADLDGDGFPELVFLYGNELGVLVNGGDGTFSAPRVATSPASPRAHRCSGISTAMAGRTSPCSATAIRAWRCSTTSAFPDEPRRSSVRISDPVQPDRPSARRCRPLALAACGRRRGGSLRGMAIDPTIEALGACPRARWITAAETRPTSPR